MANAAAVLEKMMRGLECKVCMELLDKPKLLTCFHTFCKDCIDGMMTFNPDGSSQVKCPNRCAHVTHINNESTTNDLPSNYIAVEQLDAIEEKSKEVINKCSHDVNCANEGAVYCPTCSLILCIPCKQNHNVRVHNENNKTYSLMHDRKDNKTKVICLDHGTKADFYCCHCRDLICFYCQRRSHKTHNVETVAQQVAKIREVINNKDYGLNNVNAVTDAIKENKLLTKKSIDCVRSSLRKIIKDRKQQSLLKYLKILNKEEERIMTTFDQRSNQQINNYPKLSDLKIDITEEKEFALLINKDKIANDIADLIRPVPIVSIKLTTASDIIPLGDIHVERVGSTYAKVKPALSSVVNGISTVETQECENSTIKLVEELTKLMSQVLPSKGIEERGAMCSAPANEKQIDVLPSTRMEERGAIASAPANEEQDNVFPSKIMEERGAMCSAPANEKQIDVLPSTRMEERGAIASAPANEEQDNVLPSKRMEERGAMCSALVNEEQDNAYPTDVEYVAKLDAEYERIKIQGDDYVKKLFGEKEEQLIIHLVKRFSSLLLWKGRHDNWNFLHYAARYNCVSVTQHLIKQMNINEKNSHDSTPLHLAVWNNNVECARLLLDVNPDTSIKNDYGSTPLHYAVSNNNVECARLLLGVNPDTSIKSNDGSTPLHWAVLNNKVECARLLLDVNPDTSIKDNNGRTPLHYAVLNNYVECARLLLGVNPDTSIKSNDGSTPLHLAVLNNNVECARLLLDVNPDTSIKDNGGSTPLHMAVLNNYVECARLLLGVNPDTSIKSNDGRTPLHWAVSYNSVECARLLLGVNPDTSIKDNNGRTPAQIVSSRRGNEEMKKLFSNFEKGKLR